MSGRGFRSGWEGLQFWVGGASALGGWIESEPVWSQKPGAVGDVWSWVGGVSALGGWIISEWHLLGTCLMTEVRICRCCLVMGGRGFSSGRLSSGQAAFRCPSFSHTTHITDGPWCQNMLLSHFVKSLSRCYLWNWDAPVNNKTISGKISMSYSLTVPHQLSTGQCNVNKCIFWIFMPPAWKVYRGHLVIGLSICLSVHLSVCPFASYSTPLKYI